MRANGPPRRLDPVCAALAFFVPFCLAVAHAGSTSQWRDDLPLLRGLGLAAVGWSHAVSSVVIGLCELLPLGSRVFRGALSAAAALGGAGLAVYCLCGNLLRANARAPRLTPLVSLVTALSATLLASGQREATAAGGGSVAVLLALSALLLAATQEWPDAQRALAVGAMLGATLAENGAAGLCLAVALLGRWLVERRPPPPRFARWFAAGALGTAAALVAPAYVRPFAARVFLDLGRAASDFGRAELDGSPAGVAGVSSWLREVGPVALVLSACGAVVGGARARLRPAATELALLVTADALLSRLPGLSRLCGLPADMLGACHLLAICALGVGAGLAVHTAAALLLSAPIKTARGAAVFIVMFHLTIAATSAEEASFSVDSARSRGAELFTDEALERLPHRAAVLLRSQPLARRLWVDRLLEGARPDVLLIAAPLLGDGRAARRLLREEPAAQALLRDISLEGRAGEQALTLLADARPLEMELEPSYNRRLISHMVADHLWLRFFPQPLGASDRRSAFVGLRTRLGELAQRSGVDLDIDAITAAALRARIRDHATAAAALGDREDASTLLGELEKTVGGDMFVVELTKRLGASKSGPVDTKGLLR